MGYFYIFGTIFFTVYGQLILKWRINDFGTLPDGILEKIQFLFNLLLDPWVFSGFISAFVASFFWMAAMTKFDVSHAYPIIVGGLAILTSIFAVIFLKESVNILKIMGVIMIVAGVFFLSKGS
jgi:multidrug transporter EmrE-like cation transporter